MGRVGTIAGALAGVAVAAVAATVIASALPADRPATTGQGGGQVAYGAITQLGTAPDVATAAKRLQDRLHRLPKDHTAWAELGLAYVQQARITADPTYYPKAEQAVDRSLALVPDDFAGLTADAALAAGRHEFADAVRLATQATKANPYGPLAFGVLADAHTQLGQYKEATHAIDQMMRLAPGVSSFARASYDAELHGDRATAARMLDYALRDAYTPADIAFCRFYLGELALRSGDTPAAADHYAKAADADPAYIPALAGQARAAALDGRLAEAAATYETVTERLPLAQYLVEYGEVLERLGRDARPQWALLAAQRDLMRANGVRDDLTWAEFEADHGSPATAVEYARAEYARHPNAVAADALGWALHKNGEDREALPYATKATATGWHNALIDYHRATIERALGHDATHWSKRVKADNPHFTPTLPALQRPS
ncbi:tetratricopeptide repeat protein [Streptosporangiaceae bacterium NEAU-GS5]|nr:tetratricopeptide repeat protein [Streptosporangiaceae bacterium NEAU-GS5]